MTKDQAKRIALAFNGSSLVSGCLAEGITGILSESDGNMFHHCQEELGWQMLREAGFENPMTPAEIVATVLGSKSAKTQPGQVAKEYDIAPCSLCDCAEPEQQLNKIKCPICSNTSQGNSMAEAVNKWNVSRNVTGRDFSIRNWPYYN